MKSYKKTWFKVSMLIFFAFWFLIGSIGAFSDNQTKTTDKSLIVKKEDKQITENAKEETKLTEVSSEEKGDKEKQLVVNTTINGELKIHFINVGQADSILLQQGNAAMLIDAGNNSDAELVQKYIKDQGITKLDFVIGTHPHEDHIGGLDYIINNFPIDKLYMPKITSNTKTFEDVVSAISNKGLNITTPTTGSSFKFGEANCTILAPNSNSYENLNNYSIVIKITFGNNSFMFEGDAEAISEMEMVKKGFDIKADLLKVGHHGSSSSTCANFLSAVNPQFAVISVGEDNTYGHPHEGTMNRLKTRGIPVYRTDQCGTIICTSDGTNIKFNTKTGDYSFRGTGTTSTNSNSATTNTNTKTVTPSNTTNGEMKVYITKTGEKYHLAGCSSLSKSKIEIILKEAVEKGDTPCSRCNPPTLK